MAIAAVVPTNGTGTSTSDATSYATGTLSTLTTGTLELFGVVTGRVLSGSPTTPTVSGCSLTWVQITDIAFDSSTGTNDFKLTVFRAMGTPTSGTLTISYGGAAQESCVWGLVEVSGTDTTGTNGSGAIVQSPAGVKTSTSPISVTLSAFGDAVNNAAFGFFGLDANAAITQEGGYTELLDLGQSDTFSPSRLEAAWLLGQDTTVTASWSGSQEAGAVALEIKAAAATLGIYPQSIGAN